MTISLNRGCAQCTIPTISLLGIEGGGLASGSFSCRWEEAALVLDFTGGVLARAGGAREAGVMVVGGGF